MTMLAALGVWLSAVLDHMWWESVISGVTFGKPYGIYLLSIVGWVPSLLVFACLGASFARFADPATTVRWAAGLGALGSAYWFFSSQVVFPERPAIIDSAWAYSPGVVPLAASVVGWWLVRRASKGPHPAPEDGAVG